jgi:RNA polymerase sigma-70 factor (ECF subfamily)
MGCKCIILNLIEQELFKISPISPFHLRPIQVEMLNHLTSPHLPCKGKSLLPCLRTMILILEEQLMAGSAFKKKLVDINTDDLYRKYFEAYFEGLFTYAYTIVKDSAEARDIAQTSFIKLWQKRKEIDFSGKAKSYLYTTAYHLALNTVRNRKTHQQHQESLQNKNAPATIYTSEQKEIRNRIREAINQLPPRCREIFLKSRLEGRKYAEIAGELNISVKTVEVQMGRALKFLKEQLADIIKIAIFYLYLP